jgi:hypothetical protein
VVGHDLPDAFEVDVEVSVRCDVAEAVDLPPRDLWVPVLELLAELGGSIREDLEPPQDRVLTCRCSKKAVRPSRT